MRNLKKVLSLVLAVAMMVSICVVGAGAVNYDEFTDKGEITKKEAVETLVNLDVLNGYDGGATFKPTANVTRAEMATIICRVLAGGDALIVDATKPVPTYTDIDGHWAESYIEYCTSLGIVSGKGNGIFDPQANVTAAEAAKMVMTAVGYNADIEGFKGAGWDINTMAKANNLKLTNNLQNEISANVPVTREQVAQLIYNALTIPMVQNYVGTVANVWIGSGANAYTQTLLEKAFGAKKVTGVVIANEYASLLDTTPIAKGKTELLLLDDEGSIAYTGDWEKYISTKEFEEDLLTVKVSTTLEQVGSSVTVMYKTNTRQDVFGVVMDSGLNNVVEFTEGGKLKTDELKFGEKYDTEYFVNYDNFIASETVSEYRIRYVVISDVESAALVEGGMKTTDTKAPYTYSKSIAPGDELTDFDLTQIRNIFRTADLEKDNAIVKGEVYVGTQSKEDVSDTMSYRQFENKYLTTGDTTYTYFDKNENGNYVKLVDFDNDGIAEFAFKIAYTMDEITKVAKNGDLSFYGDGIDTSKTGNVDEVVAEDGLAAGDVVVYTIIDRIAYVELADVVTATVKTVSYKNDTITTTDGDTYGQSEIINDTGYAQYIADVDEKTEYNFYFDKYGYIRAYNEVEGSAVYGLLTEAYTTNYQNGKYIKNTIGIVETKLGDADLEEYEVTNYDDIKDGRNFFTYAYNTNRFTSAGKMIESELVTAFPKAGTIPGTYVPKDAWTNVAKYVLTDDGIDLASPVKLATNKAGEQLYYTDADHDDKVTEAEWIAAYKKANTTATTSAAHDAFVAAKLDKVYAVNYVELDKTQDLAAKAWKFMIDDTDPTYVASNNTYINAVHDTEFYLVQGTKVTYFTDYTKLPAIDAIKDQVTAMYAVAENTEADSNKADYWVANVIVIELDNWQIDYDSISLAYCNPWKEVDTVRNIDTLNNQTEDPKVNVVPADKKAWDGQWVGYGFYRLYETETTDDGLTAKNIKPIEDSFNSYGIYAGEIVRIEKTSERGGYMVVNQGNTAANATTTRVTTTDVPVYVVEDKSTTRIDRYESIDAVLGTGDTIIWVTNKDKSVAYIVLVDDATVKGTDSAAWVKYLYADIVADTNKVAPDNAVVKLTKQIEAITEITAENKDAAQALVDSVASVKTEGASAPELKALQDAAKDLQDMIDAFDAQTNADTVKNNVKTFGETYIASKADVWTPGITDAANAALTDYLAGDTTPTDTEAQAAIDAAAWAVYNNQNAALALLNPYTASDYNSTEWTEISRILSEAETAIKASSADAEVMNKIATDANTAADAVKTAAELADEKTVADAKTAIEALDDTDALSVNDYTEDEVKTAVNFSLNGATVESVQIGTVNADGAVATISLKAGEATATATVKVVKA